MGSHLGKLREKERENFEFFKFELKLNFLSSEGLEISFFLKLVASCR